MVRFGLLGIWRQIHAFAVDWVLSETRSISFVTKWEEQNGPKAVISKETAVAVGQSGGLLIFLWLGSCSGFFFVFFFSCAQV